MDSLRKHFCFWEYEQAKRIEDWHHLFWTGRSTSLNFISVSNGEEPGPYLLDSDLHCPGREGRCKKMPCTLQFCLGTQVRGTSDPPMMGLLDHKISKPTDLLYSCNSSSPPLIGQYSSPWMSQNVFTSLVNSDEGWLLFQLHKCGQVGFKPFFLA